MKNVMRYILMCVISLFAFSSCDIHEFPNPESGELVPFTLHLNFHTEREFHKEFTYTRNGDVTEGTSTDGITIDSATKTPYELHCFRYVIKAYRTDVLKNENRVADTTFVFTRNNYEETFNHTLTLELPEGQYDLRAWCDFVDIGSTEDKYYDTRDFSKITLLNDGGKNHSGGNDYREAYRGLVPVTVTNPKYYSGDIVETFDNEATIEMNSPMGKYEVISTDVEAFLTRVIQMMQLKGELNSIGSSPSFEQMLQSVNLEDYQIEVSYPQYMPYQYNLFTDKAGDSQFQSVSYRSPMRLQNNNTEMLLGHDLVFVNTSTGNYVSVMVRVLDKDDNELSRSNSVDLQLMQGKYTIAKGEFLTSQATGGAVINPGYDGPDYNVPVDL